MARMDLNHLSVCTNNGCPTHLPLKNIQLSVEYFV
nr:MAG TPA: hypothetical protein [Bacteriophage sp.]